MLAHSYMRIAFSAFPCCSLAANLSPRKNYLRLKRMVAFAWMHELNQSHLWSHKKVWSHKKGINGKVEYVNYKTVRITSEQVLVLVLPSWGLVLVLALKLYPTPMLPACTACTYSGKSANSQSTGTEVC